MNISHSNKIFYWLISGCILISMMVVVGGITRLTRSGLSIVEWKPIEGIIPPLTNKDWTLEFEMYQKSPEFKFYNSHFTLNDFKQIYFWEYLHRLIGRIIGLVFIIPCVFFWMQNRFSKEMKIKVALILVGGVFQGFLGWFMVKSGLVKDPHVSHFRLAAHLITALLLIAYIYDCALFVKYQNAYKTTLKISFWIKMFFVLILFQITYVAFVAGLKAGLMYNNFPKMGDKWISTDVLYGLKNKRLMALIEVPAVIQLIHRILAFCCLIGAVFIWLKLKFEVHFLKKKMEVILFFILIQIVLGILTLLFAVPIYLGVIHQVIAILIVVLIVHLLFHTSRNCKHQQC